MNNLARRSWDGTALLERRVAAGPPDSSSSSSSDSSGDSSGSVGGSRSGGSSDGHGSSSQSLLEFAHHEGGAALKVLRQVHPAADISEAARLLLEDFLQDIFQQIVDRAATMSRPGRSSKEAKESTAFFECIDSIEIVGSRGTDSLLLSESEGDDRFWMSRTELLADLEICPQNKTSDNSLRGKINAWEALSKEEKLAKFHKWVKRMAGCDDATYFIGGVDSRDIQSAVRMILPGELAKHAVSEGTKAVTKMTSSSPSDSTATRAEIAGLVFPVALIGKKVVARVGRSTTFVNITYSVTQSLNSPELHELVLTRFVPCPPPQSLLSLSLSPLANISSGAATYLAAVMEYMCSELLELSGNAARDTSGRDIPTLSTQGNDVYGGSASVSTALPTAVFGGGGTSSGTSSQPVASASPVQATCERARDVIEPRHIALAISNDEELRAFAGEVVILGALNYGSGTFGSEAAKRKKIRRRVKASAKAPAVEGSGQENDDDDDDDDDGEDHGENVAMDDEEYEEEDDFDEDHELHDDEFYEESAEGDDDDDEGGDDYLPRGWGALQQPEDEVVTLSDDDWAARLARAGKSVPPNYLDELVMNYLVCEGFKDAAAALQRESGVDPAADVSADDTIK